MAKVGLTVSLYLFCDDLYDSACEIGDKKEGQLMNIKNLVFFVRIASA